MFAPIIDFRTLVGLGPRIVEHALDTVPLHAFPAWEDVRLKGKSAEVPRQPPRPVSPEPSTSPRRDAADGASVADASGDQATLVVLAGAVTPQRLQRRYQAIEMFPMSSVFLCNRPSKKPFRNLPPQAGFLTRFSV